MGTDNPIIEPQMLKLVKADRLVTIERCAEVAERWREWDDRPPSPEAIAAAIRKLKDTA